MDLELADTAALVTASASGLGPACTRALADEGANVTLCGRDRERLERVRERIADGTRGDVLAVRADVTDPDDVSRAVRETVDTFGGLDGLVAGGAEPPRTTFLETDERDWYRAYDALVMSVVWAIEESHEHLLASEHGTITCLTPRASRGGSGSEGVAPSNAVGGAVVELVTTVSREFAPEIRANAVRPGAIETARTEERLEARVERGTHDDYEAGLAAMADGIPMKRVGEPRELGDVVAFLSSPKASFVNGAEIPVDGGPAGR
ncbi:SDR family oxidoreductase [Natronobacterium haloterrestre]|nr:SDR family oxidoreductase [Halobiforma haloterrestris]